MMSSEARPAGPDAPPANVRTAPLSAARCLLLFALLAACLAACRGAVTEPAPTPAPLSLDEYRGRVDAGLQAIEDHANGDAEGRLAAAEKAVGDIQTVLLPSGDKITVNPLILKAPRDSLDAATRRLRLMQRQLMLASRDDAPARLSQLRTILDRPAYAGNGPTLRERVQNWLRDLLHRLFPNQDPARTPSANAIVENTVRALGWLLAAAGAIVVVGLLGYWLSRLLRSFVAGEEAGRNENGAGHPLTPAAARLEAAAARAAGNYREAMRLLYLALLLQIEEQGLLRHDPSLTNRELLARVTPVAPAIGARLAPVVQTFDDVWYGMREPDAPGYHDYENTVAGVARLIAETRQLSTNVEADPDHA